MPDVGLDDFMVAHHRESTTRSVSHASLDAARLERQYAGIRIALISVEGAISDCTKDQDLLLHSLHSARHALLAAYVLQGRRGGAHAGDEDQPGAAADRT